MSQFPFPLPFLVPPFPCPPFPIYVCLHLMRFLFKILYSELPLSLSLLPSSPSLLLSVVAEGASLLPPSCCQRSRVHWTHFALTLTLVGAKKYVCVACVASLKFYPPPPLLLHCTLSLSANAKLFLLFLRLLLLLLFCFLYLQYSCLCLCICVCVCE